MRNLRPAPLPAHLVAWGDIVLTDPADNKPRRVLGSVVETLDQRGTLTIRVRTSPASVFTITTKDYDRPVWVHVPFGSA